MPELPEVEVVRAGLEPALVGARIDSVHVFDPRSLKRHDARRGDFVGMLQGSTVLSAERRGKFMWFPLDSGDALVTHLGMSGQVLLRDSGAKPDRHLRIQYGITHPEHGKLLVNKVDQQLSVLRQHTLPWTLSILSLMTRCSSLGCEERARVSSVLF